MLSHYIATGLGGALGAILRVGLMSLFPVSVSGIPLQILCVNVIGCFTMGVLVEIWALNIALTETMRYFLISGLLGGFTTFSAFALEFGLLVEKNQHGAAIFYTLLSVGLSLTFFFMGLKAVRLV